jgi:alpha-L-fucosidase
VTARTFTQEVASLQTRQLPDWFRDAKLGIFVHWTAATVPAFAPLSPDPFTMAAEHGWEHALAHSPYVEWYQNSLSIEGSPVALHHAQHWPGVPYDEFVRRFREAVEQWDPAPWAELFSAAGAGYCVFVTKHHDGVTLWPSSTPNPHRGSGWSTRRNCVRELADAVRHTGLRYGVYYSGGLDWTFGGLPIDSFPAMIKAIPQSPEYCAYVDAHWRELIDMVEPDVLWHDISYPAGADGPQLMADFYNRNPEGVVNDRHDFMGVAAGTAHADFVTPEYASHKELPSRPFEVCRGIGRSFGYNAFEPDEDHISVTELVRTFVDIVARGGNLLLNVGPTATGEIPDAQAARLLGLGHWIARHREAIVGSRPWERATGTTTDGIDVRYTARPDRPGAIYATLLDTPPAVDVELDVRPPDGGSVRRLGERVDLPWVPTDRGCRIALPVPAAQTPALTFRLSP